jgi:hypothetical protein
MTPKQKEFYADKAVDLAHIIGGALVIGQFVSERFEIIVICFRSDSVYPLVCG